MKRCTRCGEHNPLADFLSVPAGESRDGHGVYCRSCRAAISRAWRSANREQSRIIDRASKARLRGEVLAAYGGACECCGEATPEFLAIDHKHNDGAQDRAAGLGSGTPFYQWLKGQGYPRDRYRLLCHNCNMARSRYRTCPHERLQLRAV